MISLLILSSDGYSDCWDPLFFSLSKYFPESKNFDVILSTNCHKYSHKDFDINCITHGKDMPWSRRLKNSLSAAKYEIIMVLVEDFFLRSPLNYSIFYSYVKFIKDPETKIDHIRLTLTLNKIDLIPSQYDNLDRIAPKTKMRFTYLPGLWKRKVLEKYITDFETPFLSETMGRYRSWIMKDGFYAVSKAYIQEHGQFYDSEPSGIIFKGKWPRWVPALFEKEGLYMDFSKRGIADKAFREKTRINSKKQILKDPIPFIRSVLSVLVLYLHSLFSPSRN